LLATVNTTLDDTNNMLAKVEWNNYTLEAQKHLLEATLRWMTPCDLRRWCRTSPLPDTKETPLQHPRHPHWSSSLWSRSL
jgi:hypothetical protein